MPKLYLNQPRLTYSVCWTVIKHRERIQKFRETCNLRRIFKKNLDKACFSHDHTCFDITDLSKITI